MLTHSLAQPVTPPRALPGLSANHKVAELDETVRQTALGCLEQAVLQAAQLFAPVSQEPDTPLEFELNPSRAPLEHQVENRLQTLFRSALDQGAALATLGGCPDTLARWSRNAFFRITVEEAFSLAGHGPDRGERLLAHVGYQPTLVSGQTGRSIAVWLPYAGRMAEVKPTGKPILSVHWSDLLLALTQAASAEVFNS